MKKLFVTTPIYYVNGKPHLGHVYTSIAADVIARFHRMSDCEVFFLTGTDEHGQKVEKTALEQKLTPQDFVDQISHTFQQLQAPFNLSYDRFIRTTEPAHKISAQALWSKIYDAGYIYKSNYSGWYSIRDEAYYQESEIIDGKAPTGAPVEWVEEESYFFKLSAFQDQLLQYYAQNPEAIAPKGRYNEVMSFLQGGLKDLSISRSTFAWGIPVPNDPKHVMYVWMDALANYITAIGYPDKLDQDLWDNSLHLIGKDILRFHAVYWPAFLLAAELKPAKRIFAHGWWICEGEKMSKSLGNVINPLHLVETYGADQLRYFLIREVPFGQDGDFALSSFINRINSDLANDYGNLCQRVFSFIHKNLAGIIPAPAKMLEADQLILHNANHALETCKSFVAEQALHKYCETAWQVISEANRFIDHQQPWALKKTDVERMNTVLYVLLDIIRKISLLASPIIPNASSKALSWLNIDDQHRSFEHFNLELAVGSKLQEVNALFPRVDPKVHN